MKVLSRIQRWWQRRNDPASARQRDAPLREFIYLDEISVHSLTASRRGAIPTEFTDTAATSREADLATSVNTGIVGLLRGGVSSRLQETRSAGSQVLRKAIVQTTFKELHEAVEESLRLRPLGEADEAPSEVDSSERLEHLAEAAEHWVVPADALQRGDLVEVDVELATDAMFRVGAVIASILEMLRASDELTRVSRTASDLDEVAAMARIIERLLAGLVPIRGRAVDLEVIEAHGQAWVVHRDIAQRLATDQVLVRHPLHVVGVAEEALFWKDIRRLLFSNARYRVLGRVSRAGVHPTWTPVKLVDVLREVAPDLALQLNSLSEELVAATLAASASPSSASEDSDRDHVVAYAKALAARAGHTLSESELIELASPPVDPVATGDFLYAARLARFRAVPEAFKKRFGVTVEPAVAAELRARYMSPAVSHDGIVRVVPPTTLSPVGVKERFLDLEFIAMYW